MVLHDSSFFSVNEKLNETTFRSIVVSHSPLFYSSWTFILSLIGCFTNMISFVKLTLLMSDYHRRKKCSQITNIVSNHFLSHQKYRFLWILVGNNLALAFLSLISCINERYFYQSFIARLRLCSVYIFLWKFTLHFLPVLTIFVLLRYHYKVHQYFPSKLTLTSTAHQLLCTDLCILIAFVLALAWSVDGLWLWGDIKMKDFRPASPVTSESRARGDAGPMDENVAWKLAQIYGPNFRRKDQEFICYLRLNKNLNFTARLLYLVQMDYVLLFSLHLLGLLLEISLQIRLSFCLMAKKITSFFLHEQQLAVYILHLFMCFTVTSLPFYFYRATEILFDWQPFSSQDGFINSSMFAQVLLAGISLQPILFAILFLPAKFLFRFKCYTSIRLVPHPLDVPLNVKHPLSRMHDSRSSLQVASMQPKVFCRPRILSTPIVTSNTTASLNGSMLPDIAEDVSTVTHLQ